MSEFLGLVSILLAILLTWITTRIYPRVGNILWVALAVRIVVILLGYYVVALPDSGADAKHFEMRAWEWGQNGFFLALENFIGPSSYFISWVISILYSLTDRSILMAQSVSIFFGMGTVFSGWLLARKLWGEKGAAKAGWILALFPTLVLYSVSILREVYVSFFLIIALHGVVNWARTGGFKSIVLALSGFVGATFFHGAMIIGAVIFLLIIGFEALIKSVRALVYGRADIRSTVLIGFVGLSMFVYIFGLISVPKLGTFKETVNVERLLRKIDQVTIGSGSYPDWATPSTATELTYKGPIRVIYFMFAPFPWDVHKFKHVVGLLDGLLYMILIFLIWKNRNLIWKDRVLKILLLILICYLLVFGLTIGNWGTGVRHRSKFVAGLVVLIAPMLPKITSRKKHSKV